MNMLAEIGIDEEGRAYLALSCMTSVDMDMLRYMRSYLPLRFPETSSGLPNDGNVRIVGDRLPGSGKADR